MRIVIDLQGAQTESRFRGIGRYSLSLALAIVRNRGIHDVHLVLNGLLADSIDDIRNAFSNLLPAENIHVWYAPKPIAEMDGANVERRKVAELIREGFIANLRPDIIHVSSIIEGYLDDAVVSIGRFDTQTPVSVSHYDLIPLLNSSEYLNTNPDYSRHYLGKVEELQRASLVLSISEYSRLEGIEHLTVSPENLINVSTSIDGIFNRIYVSEVEKSEFFSELEIDRPFVFYTGGSDERKNLSQLIKAYASLPPSVRNTHQLVFAGKMPASHIDKFLMEAKSSGLQPDDLRILGYVDDEKLVKLYSLCKVFVFPSWHEGFGLPPLEAMACGAATIGAETSSIPEVIGREDALFNPFDVSSIKNKLLQVLEDEVYRNELSSYGIKRAKKFTWDESARRAILAFETYLQLHPKKKSINTVLPKKKLAFVSPLPPERSGISGYSAELLPELSKFYDIEIVVSQQTVNDRWVLENHPVRDPQWLLDNSYLIDRVIYQMGNSPFHQHMMELMELVPGVIVLHDFFLSGLMSYLQESEILKGAWDDALYESHGYLAIYKKYNELSAEEVKLIYPVNLKPLQEAVGIVLHSDYARGLVNQWYGEQLSGKCNVIPLLRQPPIGLNKLDSRKALGIESGEFVVCSFGFLDSTKLNHKLLEAWVDSALSKDPSCKLFFVGDICNPSYFDVLNVIINKSRFPENIKITGWADATAFSQYLSVSDVAVQLRERSRGETSAAVLDCMNYGIPTIVNANGSFAELPADAVIMLSDDFAVCDLSGALERLRDGLELREELAGVAHNFVSQKHAPSICAQMYFDALESFYAEEKYGLDMLIRSISDNINNTFFAESSIELADALGRSFLPSKICRTVFLDITATHVTDLKTGIERVALSVLKNLLKRDVPGVRFEPVYLCEHDGSWVYMAAKKFSFDLLGGGATTVADFPVAPRGGDIILSLDLSGDTLVQAFDSGYLPKLRNEGVKLLATVFDCLPLTMPHNFPPEAELPFSSWLNIVSKIDGAVCISESVAVELMGLLSKEKKLKPNYSIEWFHLGADLQNNIFEVREELVDETIVARIGDKVTFLMVGTVEPRKGHLSVVETFNRLWEKGYDLNLVIIGKEGWLNVASQSRRNLPEIVHAIKSNPECGKHLFWYQDVNDSTLERIYEESTCLIFASEGEGFGLPLIEAVHKKLPIIAQDIPIFREIASDNAQYYNGAKKNSLGDAIEEWLSLYANNTHPKSSQITWLSWEQSVDRLLQVIL